MTALHLPHGRILALDHPRIMGILNVTPDSFSDGGRFTEQDAAAEQAALMLQQGADIIDVGGESTRPGAQRVPAAEQLRRVMGIIRRVRRLIDDARAPAAISIDTTLGSVAEAALDAGADILNDVSAGREDPALLALAAERHVPIVLMHMQGTPQTMQQDPAYQNVVAEVRQFLLERAAAAEAAGVPRGQIVLDPGIGFGKTKQHNLALLAALPQLVATGHALLLGASRKRFMGAICQGAGGQPPVPAELVGATCATTALGVAAGVTIFRVHDVQPNRQAADVAWAILNS